jgi:alkanesulfonate monooxygenase SsuD/methylene tetrahydromethanopterin reductase-like flavin-dependent oxidoreductase (luciferase family)
MKFSNFLFPESGAPERDREVIDQALREAELCDALGFDALWLAEHHFDGGCAYVDPLTFATAIAARTTQIHIGFAVVQMALHHPIRLAEQVALLDNLSRGRIIVGLGRGTAYNFYEYRGYGIDPAEAHGRLLEAEEILTRVWTTKDYTHLGTYWQLRLPELRPQVYQQPHPPIVRACSGLESTLAMARQGRPFMMNIQSNEVTRQRFDLYRQTMAAAGYDDATIAHTMAHCWAWRNIVVAETDAEAEAIGVPAFRHMREHLNNARRRLNAPDDQRLMSAGAAAARDTVEHGLIYGSPATVCEQLAAVQGIGMGGLILHFRLGPMPWDATENSLRLFAEKVAPEFRTPVAQGGAVQDHTGSLG